MERTHQACFADTPNIHSASESHHMYTTLNAQVKTPERGGCIDRLAAHARAS
jgi:hypothetical protein